MSNKLNIIFEDEQVLVVDKPAGVVVNRSQTIKGPTLQDELSEYFKLTLPQGSDPNIGGRAGIVHRLDRETSGLLVVAKTQEAFENLQRQFAQRTVKKEYLALVHGKVKESQGVVESKIGRVGRFGKFGVVESGRSASTDFGVVEYYRFNKGRFNQLIYSSSDPPTGGESRSFLKVSSRQARTGITRSRINYLKNHAVGYTLLRLFPKTGRTHQIRVHAKSIGHPIVSDLIYCPRKLVKFDLLWCPRLFLHARLLEFTHPTTFDKLTFKSNLPKDLENAMLNLNQISNIKIMEVLDKLEQ